MARVGHRSRVLQLPAAAATVVANRNVRRVGGGAVVRVAVPVTVVGAIAAVVADAVAVAAVSAVPTVIAAVAAVAAVIPAAVAEADGEATAVSAAVAPAAAMVGRRRRFRVEFAGRN